MFQVSNRDSRTTLLTSLRCANFEHILHIFLISIVDSEQVNDTNILNMLNSRLASTADG